MFEDKTTDEVLNNMLSNVDDTYIKQAGFFNYDILKACAISISDIFTNGLESLYNKIDVDNLIGDDLTKFVLQRKGVVRKVGNAATTSLTVNGTGTVNVGDLFETEGGIQFQATETVDITTTGTVPVQCTEIGVEGNVGASTITQIPVTLTGITSCNNASAVTDGYEPETDDALRERFYEILKQPATSGNKYHYIQWAKECDGIGDAKCLPLWSGNNTVKVIVIDDNKQPAPQTIIDRCQNYIDPLNSDGQPSGSGLGQAPIGAECKVVSATGLPINISVKITKLVNYTDNDIVTNITTTITNYLKSIAFKQDYVSYAMIGSLILATTGVQDYQNLTINNAINNVIVADDAVGIMGSVTLSE